MSQPVGSPRPVVTPTRTKTRASTPTISAPKRPARTDTDRPAPRGTGGASGAIDGATTTSASTEVRTATSSTGGSSTPTKVANPRKARPATPLSADAKELLELAEKSRTGRVLMPADGRTWDPASDDLTTAQNAHYSNTPAEMREALENDYNFVEGDLRVRDDGELVMAHDSDKEGDGLTLDEWLAIGGAGERGLKIDVKESEAIPELLDKLEASDIPDGRIMLNVGTGVGRSGIREMRDRFPDAWLAINPSPGDDNDYGPDDLKDATDLADAAGGRIAFPLRWDLVDQGVIDTLKPHGKVSIWTSTSRGTPDHPDRETRRLRDQGVEGVIDFGPPQSTLENLAERGLDIWESGPVTSARNFVGGVPGAIGDAWDGVRNLGGWLGDRGNDVLDTGGDLLSSAGDVAEDLPLVGGLFG